MHILFFQLLLFDYYQFFPGPLQIQNQKYAIGFQYFEKSVFYLTKEFLVDKALHLMNYRHPIAVLTNLVQLLYLDLKSK